MASAARAARNGDSYSIRLSRHTGMVIIGQTRTSVQRGTYEECLAAYRSAQQHNLAFGWWGIISLLLYNWIAIIQNVRAKSQLQALHATG